MPAKEDLHVAILREAYQRWRDTEGASIDHWISICADEIVFGSLVQGADPMNYMRLYTRRDDLRQYLGGIRADWDMLEFEAEQFVAQDDRVVMLGYCSQLCRSTGRKVWTPLAHSWRFKDGLAVEYYEFFDTARAFAAMSPAA